MVFQNYALFPHLTVFENIAFPLRMRRAPQAEIERDVAAALDTVRLGGMAGRFPRELSGGQQQRVALARCFVYRPSIILMDEPLGALDKKLRDEMQLEIKQLHSAIGITVLYVTHDQEEALAMSDRICLMNRGGIEQVGTADDLYFRPRSLFAAQFLGDSNILPVTVAEAGVRLALVGPREQRFTAPFDASAPPGAKANLMVRPENLHILNGSAEPENVVEGAVVDVIMVGGVTRTLVRLESGEVLSSKRLTGRGPRLQPGARLRLGWAAEDGVLLTRASTRPS
jgi:putative spermidine/putrescine transport system ATP-binding protein